jgi:hypothetical protein
MPGIAGVTRTRLAQCTRVCSADGSCSTAHGVLEAAVAFNCVSQVSLTMLSMRDDNPPG